MKKKKYKSKVGFWTRIRNVIDNSPWHAAFTYPIAYIILWTVVFAILASIKVPDIIVNTFMLAFFIAPIWVLIGIIIAKKRLPYLLSLLTGLVVVPVLIGTFAYTSFTGSARIAATKTIHAQTIKYIKSEYDKCRNGETLIMNNTLKCSDMNSKNLIQAALNTMTDKNPHHPEHPNANRSSSSNTNDEDVGYVSFSASGSNIIIKTCIKTPCKKEENRLQASIGIE